MNKIFPILLLAGFGTPVAAQTIGPVDQIVVGDPTTQEIDTNLDGHPVPADIGQIYIGNTTHSADAITIDSGSNFPPGIAFRRYLGDPTAPVVVTPGTQLGYLDFRAYSGTQFFNAASLDVVVDGMIPFADGELPGTKMRFAVSDGQRVYVPVEIRANGRLEVGAIDGADYFGPGALGDPKLFVNSSDSRWSTIFAARPAAGPGYALRLHTAGETADDYILGGSSGADSGSFKFSVRGNGDVYVGGGLFLGGVDIGSALGDLNTRLDDLSVGGVEMASAVDALNARLEASALALGSNASSTSANSTAIGNGTTATGNNALAIGNGARGNGDSAISMGDATIASGAGAVAFGSGSISTGLSSTALGQNAKATRENTLAVGAGALAQALNATSLGFKAVSLESGATALGANARASHEGATAVGAGAATTAANQVALGGAGSSVRVGDIDASTAAQVGPVDVVTVDRQGTLGRQQVVTSSQLHNVQAGLIQALAVSDAQFAALGNRVERVEDQVGELFGIVAVQREETRQGIAAVASLAQPHFPSAPGRTSYASNVGYFRGEVGFSAGMMRRFEGGFALGASVSFAGGDNTAARIGIAGEF